MIHLTNKVQKEKWCPENSVSTHCLKLKAYLVKRNIDFEERIDGKAIIIDIRKTKPMDKNIA